MSKLTDLDDLRSYLPDWKTHLKARNIAPSTIYSYERCALNLIAFLDKEGLPTAAKAVEQKHIEAFLADGQDRWSAANVAKHYRSLQQFWKWLENEEEIDRSPMAKMKPPAVPEQPVPVISDAELTLILKAASGTDFDARRDTAILRCYIDTGCRLDEIASLKLDGVDFDMDVLHVMGKGRRARSSPFGPKTSEALRKYLRVRARHEHAEKSDKLWLGMRGGMTASGVYQAIDRRARQAGLKVHPHQFRHTAAHVWFKNGGSEGDAMRLFGWKSRQMPARYGASAADERAREAHKKARLGDRV